MSYEIFIQFCGFLRQPKLGVNSYSDYDQKL